MGLPIYRPIAAIALVTGECGAEPGRPRPDGPGRGCAEEHRADQHDRSEHDDVTSVFGGMSKGDPDQDQGARRNES